MQLLPAMLAPALIARSAVAILIGAMAAALVTYHWGVLLINLWLTYTGRRRIHQTVAFLSPALATAALMVWPAVPMWYVWAYCLTDPATLLGRGCPTRADRHG